jgi:hypothetical protein
MHTIWGGVHSARGGELAPDRGILGGFFLSIPQLPVIIDIIMLLAFLVCVIWGVARLPAVLMDDISGGILWLMLDVVSQSKRRMDLHRWMPNGMVEGEWREAR